MKNQFLLLIFSLAFIFCINANAQWVEVSKLPSTVNDENFLIVSGSDIFCGTDDGVYVSTDIGTSWAAANNGLPNSRYVDALDLIGNKIFAGLDGGRGFYYSTDNGKNWNVINTNPTLIVNCLASDGSNIFAGTESGIYLSTDNGTNWTAVNNGLPDYPIVTSIVSSGSNIFAVVTYHGVYISSDKGANWTSANNGLPINIECLLAKDGNIFAGTENGIYLSSDNGANWTAMNNGFTSVNIPVVYSLLQSGNNIFAGGTAFSGKGIFLSTDNGANWTAVNDGLPDGLGIYTMAVINNTLIGSTRSGIFRRPLSEMVTDIKNNQNNLPSNFALLQNYPNPFNPTTTINYSIAKSSLVTIKVYNILGDEVETLVNTFKDAGNYSIKFNADKLASGIYFYKIEAGNFVETKKLILLK